MRPALLFGVALGCCAIWTAGRAGAAPPDDAAERKGPPEVRVALIGPEPTSGFGQRLASWFQSETRVTIANAPTIVPDQILKAEPGNGVDVWVDLRPKNKVQVYLVVPAKGGVRWLVREVALESGMDELGQERLAQVVFSSSMAVWEGQAQSARVEIERRLEAAASPPVRAAQTRSSPATRASPGEPSPARGAVRRARPRSTEYSGRVGYGLSTRGPEGLAHGPELWGTLLERRGPWLLGGFLMASYLVPIETTEKELTLELTGVRGKLGVSLGRSYGEFRVEAGAGLGAELLHYQPYVTGGLQAKPGDTEVRPVMGAFVAGSVPAGPTRIVLALLADLQLERTSYQIQRATTTDDRLQPWQLQPGVALLVAFGNDRP